MPASRACCRALALSLALSGVPGEAFAQLRPVPASPAPLRAAPGIAPTTPEQQPTSLEFSVPSLDVPAPTGAPASDLPSLAPQVPLAVAPAAELLAAAPAPELLAAAEPAGAPRATPILGRRDAAPAQDEPQEDRPESAFDRLEAISASPEPSALWSGARPAGSGALVSAPLTAAGQAIAAVEGSETPSGLLREAGSAASTEAPPGVRLPSAGLRRTFADWRLYHRINLSSLWWYTFPRLIERWEELKSAIRDSGAGPHAVRDFLGFFVAHRVLGSTGSYSPLGFRVAANGIVVQDAWDIYDRYFLAGPEARAAFARFIERAERFNPNRRSTQFRKIVFHALREGSVKEPSALAGFFDSLATEDAQRVLTDFQRDHQTRILEALDRDVRETILEMNEGLPKGRRIVGALLFGSMANGAAGPGSDLDLQAISEDGSTRYNDMFYGKVKRRWAAAGMKDTPISGFQYALPLSRALIARLHREPYRIYSPYPEVARALARNAEEPVEPVSRVRTFRGWLFQALYTRFLYLVLFGYKAWRIWTKRG